MLTTLVFWTLFTPLYTLGADTTAPATSAPKLLVMPFKDLFEVYGERIKKVKMRIYNRTGEKVYESEAQHISWDGYYKGEIVHPGVYVYIAEIEYLNGSKEIAKGSVTVIR